MIYVRVELWPARQGMEKQLLGEMYIANDASGTVHKGNYNIEISKVGGFTGKRGQVWKKGRVEGFSRTARGAWDLMFLALRNIVGERNR